MSTGSEIGGRVISKIIPIFVFLFAGTIAEYSLAVFYCPGLDRRQIPRFITKPDRLSVRASRSRTRRARVIADLFRL